MKKWLLSRLTKPTAATTRPAARSGACRTVRFGVEELESRLTPASVAPGSFSNATTGQITGPIEFDQPGTYTITGDLTVAGSGTLTVGTTPGVNVVIQNNAKLTVAGSLNVTGASSFVINEGQFGGDGTSQGILVSGTMSATNTAFTVPTPASDESFIQIQSGGRLTASGSTFAWDVLAWDSTSLLSSGDVTGNAFDAAIYLPGSFVPLLAANDRFQDVNLNSGGPTGSPLTLDRLGTVTTANQRYVIPGLTGYGGTSAPFAIAGGAAVNFGPGTSVLLRNNAKVTVAAGAGLAFNGTVSSPITVAIEEGRFGGDGTSQGIMSAGTMAASNTTFTVPTPASDESFIQTQSGGRLTASGSTFAWDVLAWDTGSTLNNGDVTGNAFDTTLFIPAAFAPRLAANDRFQDVNLNSGGPTGSPLSLDLLGTITTANQRYVIPGLTGYGGTSAPFAIAGGAAVNFGPGTSVLLRNNAKVTVAAGAGLAFNGTAGNPITVAIEEGRFGGDGTSQGIVSAGTMAASNTTFTVPTPASDESFIQIQSGGRLTASGSTFGLDVLAWDTGSTLSNGDVTGNAFDTTVYLPASHVSRLTNNDRFQDVNLNSGGPTGSPLALDRLGTVTTTNQRYVIPGLTGYGGTSAPFAIAGGAAVNFGPGTSVLLRNNAKVTVAAGAGLAFNGTAGNPIAVTFEEGRFGGDGTTQGITSAGNVTATNTTFAVPTNHANDDSFAQIQSGGRLTASGSTFGLDVLAWDTGSTLNNGDVTGNAFDATIYLPAAFAPRLATNDRFQDVNLNSNSPTGSPLSLDPLGTVTTANQRYVIPGLTGYGGSNSSFLIAGGATVDVGPGTSVHIRNNAVVAVQTGGALNFNGTVSSPITATIEEGRFGNDGTSQGILVTGGFSASNTVFGFSGNSNSVEQSILQAGNGGTVALFGGTFGWNNLQIDAGSNATVNYVLVNGKITASSAATLDLSLNDFSSGTANLTTTGTTGTSVNAENNFWGTTVPGEIELFKLTDDTDNAALPAVDFNPFLTDRPVQPEGAAVPAVAYDPGNAQDINVGATFTTTVGTVNTGTATFTILSGTTVIGTPLVVNVVNGSAGGIYPLPIGTPAGTYTVRVTYSNGTDSFTDNSQTLVINPIGQTITFSTPTPVTFSAGQTITLAGTSDSNLPVTYIVVSGPGSVSGNVLTITGAGNIVVRADQAGNTNYTSASSVQTTVVVNKAAQTITFPAPPPPTFAPGLTIDLAAFSDSGLTVTYTVVSGPGSVSGNTLTVTGAGDIVILASQTGDANYTAASSVQITITVAQAPQTITFDQPPPATFTPGLTVNLAATGGVSGNPVTFTVVSGPGSVSGSTLTVTGAGNIIVQADQAGNSNYTSASSVQTTVVVNKAAQTITFPAPPPPTFAPGLTIDLAAFSDSGLTVTYTVVSGPGSVSGNTLTVTGAGDIVILASQAGDANYTAASSVQITITVAQAPQTITFDQPPPATFTPGLTVTLVATGGVSGNPITFTVVSGPGSVSGSTLTVTGAGDIIVQADQAGNANYANASSVQTTVVVNKAAQTITFPTPTPVTFAPGQSVTLMATGGASGNAVMFSVVSGPGTVSGNVLMVNGAGSIVIQADQAGNADYAGADSVQATLVVNQADQSITFAPPTPVMFGPGLTIDLDGTADSDLPVTYTVLSGPGTVSGNILTVTGAGDIVVQADQAGDVNYAAATTVQATIVVNQAGQTISFPTVSPVTFAPGLTVNLTGTSDSGLTVTYTVVSGPGSVSGNVLTITGAGDVVVRADQAGDANFTAASSVQTTVVINKATQTITFPAPITRTFTPGLTVNLSATGGATGNPVTFSVLSGPGTVSGNILTVTGAGDIVILASQAGDANYTAASSVQITITVAQAPQTITFGQPPATTFAPGLTVNLAATGGVSGNPVTFSVVSGPGSVSGNVLTVTGAGTIVVRADQAGNSNYAAATTQQTVVVNRIPQTITFSPPTPVTFTPGLTVALAASSDSSLPVIYSVASGPANITGNVLTINGGGSVSVIATQPGNSDVLAATPVQINVVVNRAPQSITFPPIPPVVFTAGRTVTLGATSDRGLAVTYTVVSGPGTVAGNVLTITGSGVIVVEAAQPGTADFTAASPVRIRLTVDSAPVPPVTTPSFGLVGYKEFAVGSGKSATVNFYGPDGTLRSSTNPLSGSPTGVRVAAGDINGDGIADQVVGTGPGVPTEVKVLDGSTGAVLFSVQPFESSFTGGVYVAVGDVNGDGVPDVIITPDEGGGPRARVFSGADFSQLADFFGIDDPNFRGGARAAVADVNGDGIGDLIVAAGFGGGPRVAVFDGTTLSSGRPAKLFNDFFAFEDTLRNGVFVAGGDINGDGKADLILGGGPGGGPRVRIADGTSLLNGVPFGTANTPPSAELADFFGGDINSRGGIRVAAKDLDGDAKADIIIGAGSGAGSRVTGYLGRTVAPGATPSEAFGLDAFDGFSDGVFVG